MLAMLQNTVVAISYVAEAQAPLTWVSLDFTTSPLCAVMLQNCPCIAVGGRQDRQSPHTSRGGSSHLWISRHPYSSPLLGLCFQDYSEPYLLQASSSEVELEVAI